VEALPRRPGRERRLVLQNCKFEIDGLIMVLLYQSSLIFLYCAIRIT